MKRHLYLPLVSLLASAITFLVDVLFRNSILPALTSGAAAGDRLLSTFLTFLDFLMPVASVAGVPGHALRPTREVAYLTRGLHRLAQPVSMRCGDPEDDDEDDDEIDNGLIGGAAGTRMNC